jgi:hypothetical protein
LLNLSVFDERTFNNLQTKFLAKVPRKEFFNTHACLHQLSHLACYKTGFRFRVDFPVLPVNRQAAGAPNDALG